MPKRKASRRAPSAPKRRGTPKCDCPSTIARKAFKEAKTCSAKSRAYDAIKSLAAKDEPLMKNKGQRALLFRDLLHKQQQVSDLCAREEAADTARFNGLGSYRRRARRRRRR